MRLDPEAEEFGAKLASTLDLDLDPGQIDDYRENVRSARDAGMPLDRPGLRIDDFFPNKRWEVLALTGYMLPDPYSAAAGVEETEAGKYRVTTRAATRKGILEVTLTLRLMEPLEEGRLIFSPLLDRFYAGYDHEARAVKISDSGRIRNELQTLASDALEHFGEDGIRIRFDDIDDAVMPPDKKRCIRNVLAWYKANHPIWFSWLEIG